MEGYKDLDFKKLGKRIKEGRTKNNLTQEDLAELVGLSAVHISHIEAGTTKMSLTAFSKLCFALKVNPDQILMDNIYSSREYVKDEIANILKKCSDQELIMFSKLLKTYTENR